MPMMIMVNGDDDDDEALHVQYSMCVQFAISSVVVFVFDACATAAPTVLWNGLYRHAKGTEQKIRCLNIYIYIFVLCGGYAMRFI